MNLQNRVEKLEQQAGAENGVRFVVEVPPKMTREEWAEYVRERTAHDPNFFTVNLNAAEAADDEPTEQS